MRYERLRISAGDRLARAVQNWCGEECRLEDQTERPWASATFTGQRHRLTLIMSGNGAHDMADRFDSRCGEIDFAFPRMILADMVVMRRDNLHTGEVRLEVEALTIDD